MFSDAALDNISCTTAVNTENTNNVVAQIPGNFNFSNQCMMVYRVQ